MKGQEANHMVHCSCTSYGSIVYRKFSSSKILMNFQWNPGTKYIVYQFGYSHASPKVISLSPPKKTKKSESKRRETRNYFFYFEQSKFIKKCKGATQLHKKYRRETPTQKKNEKKKRKSKIILKVRNMKIIIGSHPALVVFKATVISFSQDTPHYAGQNLLPQY